MPHGVFHVLGRFVGNSGKGAEGGHIAEQLTAEIPCVDGMRPAVDHGVRRVLGRFGQAERGGEIVGAAAWNIAQQRRLLQAQQAVHRMVQRAVAAAAYHNVVARAFGPGQNVLCVQPVQNGIYGRLAAACAEFLQQHVQVAGGLRAPRAGVIKKQKLFAVHHKKYLLSGR